MNAVPLTLPEANRCVSMWHRHHAPLPGGFGWYCIGAVKDGVLVGAAICGRPTNRNNHDGQTVEVLRLATDGSRNACSFLLGRAAVAAQAIGAHRIITYTLDDEGGASIRGAGWDREAVPNPVVGACLCPDWNGRGRPRAEGTASRNSCPARPQNQEDGE